MRRRTGRWSSFTPVARGIHNEYNINVLRVFCQSLTAKAKYKMVNGKETIQRVNFEATVRGRDISFNWRDINVLLGSLRKI